MPQNISEMAKYLSLLQPVGDVVPFIKKGLGPNPMNLTEGAGRAQGGGSFGGNYRVYHVPTKTYTDVGHSKETAERLAKERAIQYGGEFIVRHGSDE
jgi:hypothetical protein